MTLYKWSHTAANNATADGSVNWQEGQAPSSVNDSARAMMASIARYRDDVSGALVTSGTATAYSVSSCEVFDTFAHLDRQIIAFAPHATNGAIVTLNVDGLGARPLRSAVGVELLAGVLIQGTPYVAVCNYSDGVFYLQGFYGNPYNVPLAAGLDYWGATTPHSAFAFPAGQAINRTTYAALFAVIGTTYGVGDGSITFNLPDKTGRVSAMKESVATRLTSSYFRGDSTALGAIGGAEYQMLTTEEIPVGISVSVSGLISVTSTVGNILASNGPADNWSSIAGATSFNNQFKTAVTSVGSNFMTGTASGAGRAHLNVQPTIVCNYIMRVI